jgi:predicted O-methyltransferase YrrM
LPEHEPTGRRTSGAHHLVSGPVSSHDIADRFATVERLVADPPVVHPMAPGEDAPMGVWSTTTDCYRFIARHCPPGTRTLETGSGLSTVLFAALGAAHRCVTPGALEVERIQAYCVAHDVPVDTVIFDVAASHVALPHVTDELDLVFIDGGHGFPLPILDWFYAGSLLREGGLAVVDDLSLPAVRLLLRFLAADPRWDRVDGSAQWAAFARRSRGSLAEDWTEQPFFHVHEPGLRSFARRAVGKVRRTLRRVRAG